MRKFISILLTLSMVAGLSAFAFADGDNATEATQAAASTVNTQLTPEQQQARASYLKVYFDDMNQLVALRQQTKDAADANTALSKQIKDKVKSKTASNTDALSKLKDLASQRKALAEQLKQLRQQRTSLNSKYKAAVKAADVDKMKSIEQQILDLDNQASDLKAKDDALKTQASPLKDQQKSTKDANKQLRDNVNNQLQQVKSIRETIKTQEQEKAQLWNTYKGNMRNRDYTAAAATFKQIIDKKSAILENLKQIGTILNQVLASLN